MSADRLEVIKSGFGRARARRMAWEGLWRDCYAYALPHRAAGLGVEQQAASRAADRLFDSTAPDAVDQLAASLLAELLPPWSEWFGLRPGPDVPAGERGAFAEELDRISERLQGHFDRSNLTVEIHQCFLDLATIGTATLAFQEAPLGGPSAFRFSAVPASEMFVDGDGGGQIRRFYRRSQLTLGALCQQFGPSSIPTAIVELGAEQPDRCFEVIESVQGEQTGFVYDALLPDAGPDGPPVGAALVEGWFETSPYISFRWVKGAGELYGRSPVMTALPDIKTANKVVELILKNASIAVTGIWLADDDGVLNPANIRLVPGSIIPKAIGSAGLTPLQAPGRFDVSELVLNDLRASIRHTLLVDRLAPVTNGRMTATEILERSAEAARLLGAIYGRLQAELLTPLLLRAMGILRRRGEIPPITVDGRLVDVDYRSPLARAQAREDVRNTMMWLDAAAKLGPEAQRMIDLGAATGWLARTLGVPSELVRHDVASAEAHEPATGATSGT